MDEPNVWEPVLRFVLDEFKAVIQRRLNWFAPAIKEFLEELLDPPIPDNWREQLASFAQESYRNGVEILPHSYADIEALVEEEIAEHARATAQPVAAVRALAESPVPPIHSQIDPDGIFKNRIEQLAESAEQYYRLGDLPGYGPEQKRQLRGYLTQDAAFQQMLRAAIANAAPRAGSQALYRQLLQMFERAPQMPQFLAQARAQDDVERERAARSPQMSAISREQQEASVAKARFLELSGKVARGDVMTPAERQEYEDTANAKMFGQMLSGGRLGFLNPAYNGFGNFNDVLMAAGGLSPGPGTSLDRLGVWRAGEANPGPRTELVLPAHNSAASVEYHARFGSSSSTDYRTTFFEANPELKGKVFVHHAVEQQILTHFADTITESQLHSLENLRGIPRSINADVHLSKIRLEWNRFYREVPNPTPQQLLQKATEIDLKYGGQFMPPIRGSGS